MPYVIALDQGTTSSRAIVFDHQGNIVEVAQEEFQQIFPDPGYVEHDASEIWHTQLRVINQVVEKAGLSAGDVAAIGITNQRETTVVWERSTGLPIHNAIVWQDRRTAVRCGQLQEAGHTQKIREKTGLILDSYFSATKLQWILDDVEGARKKAATGDLAFGTIDSWLIWNLTKGQMHVTDASNASRTLLLNIHTGDWDDELLDLFEVPRGVLPNVVGSSEIYGHVADGLPLAGVPIAGIAGDQQAALFGQMCDRPGMVKNTYGTGCFMLMNTGNEAVTSKHNLLTTIAWKIDEEICYALEGSIFVAGALVQWLRDGLEFFGSASEIESLAASVPDNGGVYFVPALAGLGAPHWDPFARGTVFGLTRGTTKAHIARAALEGIAYQVADVLDAMQFDANLQLTNLRVDGGAAANNLMMQFQADLLHVPVVRPRILETTALGAAYLAGLAVGFWNDREELKEQWQIDHTFQPEMADSQVEELKRNWRKALERSKGWAD